MALTQEEMVERLLAVTDAFNRGDFDAAVEIAHPEVVFVRPGGQSEVMGVAALRAWMEPDAFESMVGELLEFERDGNKLLARLRTRARGAGSGIEMEIESWSVWTFDEDGRITRMAFFLPHEEAEARQALQSN
ncbi:MAG: nuclear transport factor 2 family protein [Solirubrobacterales bacterium]